MSKPVQTVDKTAQFGEDNIMSLMIRYSMPSIAAMLAFTMFNLINMAFVGRSVGPLGIAAIAICMPITMIQGALNQFISNGCSAAVAIKLGEGDRSDAQTILGCSMFTSVLIAAVNMAVGLLFMNPLLEVFGASEMVMPYAKDYLTISLAGMVFSTFGTMNPMLRIEGYPQQAMGTMLLMTLMNFALTPLFIFVFDMGIKGAAYGSLFAQIAMSVWILLFLTQKKRTVRLEWKYCRIKFKTLLFVMELGLPTFLMQFTQSLLSVVMNTSLGTYGGDIAISAWGVTNNINSVIAQPVFGLNQGVQPIVGYNFGAKNYMRVKQTLIYSLGGATVFSFVGWAVILLFARPIFAFFNSDPELIAVGSRMLVIFRACIFVVGFQQAGAAYFQFIGKPITSIFLTVSRQVLILIPCLLILPQIFQFDGILYSGPVSDIASTILTAVYIMFEMQRMNRLIQGKETIS
ncbi:MAG: MATE family efflux transporter [Peptococcaceae bacterium]|jgi:putative MATE family efflux protein|nr:MATE family efflux transporter [Peptococcaceae bacterium]